MADNQLSGETALAVAGELLTRELDLVIEYQIDEQAGNRIMDRFRQAGLPVIAVDIPMNGATFFGVDNYRAGHLAGVALGEWIAAHWQRAGRAGAGAGGTAGGHAAGGAHAGAVGGLAGGDWRGAGGGGSSCWIAATRRR